MCFRWGKFFFYIDKQSSKNLVLSQPRSHIASWYFDGCIQSQYIFTFFVKSRVESRLLHTHGKKEKGSGIQNQYIARDKNKNSLLRVAFDLGFASDQ